MAGFQPRRAEASDKDNRKQVIISTSSSFESYLDARASTSASGWGFSASAEFAAKSEVSYQSNQVLLIAYRDI